MGYKVFEYGNIRIDQGLDTMLAQIRLRNLYWNRLVDIEKVYQATYQAALEKQVELMGPFTSRRQTALEQLEAAKTSVKEHRKVNRTRSVPAELAARVLVTREVYQQARDALKEAQKESREQQEVKDTLAQARKDRTEAVRLARGNSGLYWGNYLDVEFYYKTARQKKGYALKFKRTQPEDGTVSVWFQKGHPLEDMGLDSRLKIKLLPAEDYERPRKERRHKALVTRFQLRLGTNPDRSPIYLEGDFVMHRPLDNGLIRHASVKRERLGRTYRYKLLVTVQTADIEMAPREGPVIGLDLGWRIFPDRIRVAYACSHDGTYEEEVSLGQAFLDRFETLRNLASIRDNRMNASKLRLRDLLAELTTAGQLPEWAQEETATLGQWRSNRRMWELLDRWERQRFPGDQAAWQALTDFVVQDQHLADWEANLRDKLLRRRRELYRVFAKQLVGRASEVRIEEFDLNRVIKQEDNLPPVEYYRTLASVSVLRLAVEAAGVKYGVPVTRVDAKNTTQICNRCGELMDFDARAAVETTCPHCGRVWDQDANAARNLAAREVTPAA